MSVSGRWGRRLRWAFALVAGIGVLLTAVIAGLRYRETLPPPASAEDLALVEALRDRISERYAEQPLDLDEARVRAAEEEASGRQATAMDTLSQAAASGDLEAELVLAIQAFRKPVPARVTPEEARALVAVLYAESPRGRLVPAARGWAKIAADDPVAALAALEEDEGSLEGRWARLRALTMLGQDALAEAEAILALAPGHEEACEVAARRSLAQGDLAAARARVRGCLSAGAGGPALSRILGDAADAAGRYAEAAQAYASAGALLHAAAILSQEDLPDTEGVIAAALADPAPPTALTAVWVQLLRGDTAAAAEAGRRLASSGVPGPEAAMAVAASRLASGDAAGALEKLSGLGSAEALVLRARSQAALGSAEEAASSFEEAVRAAPWSLAVHRERLAWLALHRPDAALEAARALAAIDPLTLGLVRDARRREAPWSVVAPSPWPAVDGVAGGLIGAVAAPESAVGALIGMDPQDALLVLPHAAWAQASQGGLDPARRLAEQAASAPTPSAGALALAAALALEAGDAPAAERWLTAGEARVTEPTAPGAAALAWTRAWQQVKAGDTAGGRVRLLEAARANPDFTGLWASLLALDEAASIPAPGPDRLTAGLGSTR